MRITCPNCGSTAQIELLWTDRDSYSTKHQKVYECGCGVQFEATYELTTKKVLSEQEKL